MYSVKKRSYLKPTPMGSGKVPYMGGGKTAYMQGGKTQGDPPAHEVSHPEVIPVKKDMTPRWDDADTWTPLMDDEFYDWVFQGGPIPKWWEGPEMIKKAAQGTKMTVNGPANGETTSEEMLESGRIEGLSGGDAKSILENLLREVIQVPQREDVLESLKGTSEITVTPDWLKSIENVVSGIGRKFKDYMGYMDPEDIARSEEIARIFEEAGWIPGAYGGKGEQVHRDRPLPHFQQTQTANTPQRTYKMGGSLKRHMKGVRPIYKRK